MDWFSFKNVDTLDATEPVNVKESGSALLSFPQSLIGTPQGKLYILDRESGAILTIERGKLVKLAGGGTGLRNGPSESALFQKPTNMCLSATNDVLIADAGNHAIRLLCGSEVTTFAGGNGAGKENGHAKGAKFDFPNAVALNALNYDVLVCDSGNHCIRVITQAVVSDFAGCGEAGKSDGPCKEAKFRRPEALLVTSTGDVIVADTQNHLIRLICDGMVSTLAGDGTPRFGDGIFANSRFNTPNGLCLSPYGDLVVVDSGNERIRLLANGSVRTIAGSGENGFEDGKALKAQFNLPTAAVWTRSGFLFVADGYNQRVRILVDENHVPSPELRIAVDLHEKPEKFSLMLGNYHIPMKGRTWHFPRAILKQRCPGVMEETVLAKLANLPISIRGQRLFWLYIFADILPEGQFGASEANVIDWIELHDMAIVTLTERLPEHSLWRTACLLSSPQSTPDLFALIAARVTEHYPNFLDHFVDILANCKTSHFALKGLTHFDKLLPSTSYARLQTKASLTTHPIARPTTSPQGMLRWAMEAICPSVSNGMNALNAKDTTNLCRPTLKLVAEGEPFYAHEGVLVPRWPLIFTWFFTREHMETAYEFPDPKQPGGLTASALLGLLRYFYTGQLDQLEKREDCALIASQTAELKLTTETCGPLLAHCWERDGSGKPDKASKDKCIVM